MILKIIISILVIFIALIIGVAILFRNFDKLKAEHEEDYFYQNKRF